MPRRHESEAGAQLGAAVLDENYLFWRVGGILNELQGGVVDLGNPASALCQQCRKRLMACNRQDPSQYLRTALKVVGLTPYVDEDLANEIFGAARVV